jgi:hypothetical protein
MNLALPLLVLVASLLAGCATPATTPADEFTRLAAKVENEIRVADKTGFLWRDTEGLLQSAREAQLGGRHEEAMRLANIALKQAQLAQVQARENANAGPSYPAR